MKTKKLTVTCTCCQTEITITKSLAAKVMQQGRTYDPEFMREIGRKGVEARKKKLSTD